MDNIMMQWDQLLSLKRYGDTNKRKRIDEDPIRKGFEVDYDRIIFSSAFRRLQDKTQVVPLPENGFVHNRLTHSLETSSVGRSLGRLAGDKLLQKHPYLVDLGYTLEDFGAIVAAAALGHDIGNPPFGHFGEKAIGSYFETGNGKFFRTFLSEEQWQDLIRFEGNANGFSILTSHQSGMQGGIRLTYATLGTFTKYPNNSIPKFNGLKSQKKFGYFQSEKIQFEEIAHELGLLFIGDHSWARHPLAYLLEAADDICYSIIDFEDGLNLGWIDPEYSLEYMIPIVKDVINQEKYRELKHSSDRFSYLRALTIGVLVQEFAELFSYYEEPIMKGQFNASLFDKSKYNAALSDIKKITIEKVYENPIVLEIEASGHQVITGLLDVFCHASYKVFIDEASYYEKHLMKLLPSEYTIDTEDTIYSLLQKMASFVSGMTDKNAISLYKKIKGISL